MVDVKRAWRRRPPVPKGTYTCSPVWKRWRYRFHDLVWEYKIWWDQEILGHCYDLEYFVNGQALSGDYQLRKSEALRRARDFSYSDSWAYLSAKVLDSEGKVVYDTTVPGPTADGVEELIDDLRGYKNIETWYIPALQEYADRLRTEEKR